MQFVPDPANRSIHCFIFSRSRHAGVQPHRVLAVYAEAVDLGAPVSAKQSPLPNGGVQSARKLAAYVGEVGAGDGRKPDTSFKKGFRPPEYAVG